MIQTISNTDPGYNIYSLTFLSIIFVQLILTVPVFEEKTFHKVSRFINATNKIHKLILRFIQTVIHYLE